MAKIVGVVVSDKMSAGLVVDHRDQVAASLWYFAPRHEVQEANAVLYWSVLAQGDGLHRPALEVHARGVLRQPRTTARAGGGRLPPGGPVRCARHAHLGASAARGTSSMSRTISPPSLPVFATDAEYMK